MGAGLIRQSPPARQMIRALEADLARLPDGPTWSLEAELLADASSSRAGEAEISQPLCTAVQLVLVDLLRASGVRFDAVVGHSSGEMAAAYAAGRLSARDAMYAGTASLRPERHAPRSLRTEGSAPPFPLCRYDKAGDGGAHRRLRRKVIA